MIPKIIHYCWFGGGPLPPLAEKCIESWKKYCPDYEIKQWNETNIPIQDYPFMKEAFEEKAWAFIPDMARLQIVYEHGGIYLDTDVEVIRNLDELLAQKAYVGIEKDPMVEDELPHIALGLGFGAEKHHPTLKKLLEYYENSHYKNSDGSVNQVASPQIQTQDFLNMGWKRENANAVVKDVAIFASEYFDPKSLFDGTLHATENTYSIHHYDGSWLKNSRSKRNILMFCKRILGAKRYSQIKKIMKK